MPAEVASARIRRTLCQQWNYTPEGARYAPVWVLRDMQILALAEQEDES